MTKRSDFQLPVRTSIDADARVIAWDPSDTNGEPFVVPVSAVAASAGLTDLFVQTAETGATSAEVMFGTRVTGDAQNRLEITADGSIKQGDGTVAPALPIDDQQWAEDNVVETMLRHEAVAIDVALGASGRTSYTHFRANRNITARTIEVTTGGTAAGATPTLVKVGLCSVAANGDLTLLGQSVNNVALFAAANTQYRIGLAASVPLTRGTVYALVVIVVSGATLPTFVGMTVNPAIDAGASTPVMTTRHDSQTDTVASLTRATVTAAAVWSGARVRGVATRSTAFATFDGVDDSISTPDAAPLDASTEVELVVRMRYTALPGAQAYMVLKGASSQQSYGLGLTSASRLRFFHGGNLTTWVTMDPDATVPFAADIWFWARVTWRVSDGLTQFFTAADRPDEPASWTQLGTDRTHQTGINIPNGTGALHVGSRTASADFFTGRIARAIVRTSIEGAPVLDVNPATWSTGTTFLAVTGQTMTLVGGLAITEQTETT